jgi:hypothetical protein
LPNRELDDALGLTHIASGDLSESRTGRNIRRYLVPLLRQFIYGSLAGYDDTNDAEPLALDPAKGVEVRPELDGFAGHKSVADRAKLGLFFLVYNLGNFGSGQSQITSRIRIRPRAQSARRG